MASRLANASETGSKLQPSPSLVTVPRLPCVDLAIRNKEIQPRNIQTSVLRYDKRVRHCGCFVCGAPHLYLTVLLPRTSIGESRSARIGGLAINHILEDESSFASTYTRLDRVRAIICVSHRGVIPSSGCKPNNDNATAVGCRVITKLRTMCLVPLRILTAFSAPLASLADFRGVLAAPSDSAGRI